MIIVGVTILVLLVLSGLFSSSETAFLSTSHPMVYAEAKKGNPKAKKLKALLKNMEILIGTILICNNLVNILATSLMTAFLTSILGEAGVIYATSLMTVLIVLYAEVTPKLLAIKKADAFAMNLAPFFSVLVGIFAPLTKVIEAIAKKSLRLFGISIDSDTHVTSSLEELRGAIEMFHDVPQGRHDEKAMLHSILDLSVVDIEEIMIHRGQVFSLNIDADPAHTLAQVVESPYSRFPVWKGHPENIIGVLNVKDFLRALKGHRWPFGREVLLKAMAKPWFIPATATLKEQLTAFQKRKEHFALVVDEYGVFLGIVTLEDIMEEIVGDIVDEHDDKMPGVWRHKDGSYYVRGQTTLRDLRRQLNWRFEGDDAITIAGLLMHETQTIPFPGQVFRLGSFTMQVLKRNHNQILLLRVTEEPLGKETL